MKRYYIKTHSWDMQFAESTVASIADPMFNSFFEKREVFDSFMSCDNTAIVYFQS